MRPRRSCDRPVGGAGSWSGPVRGAGLSTSAAFVRRICALCMRAAPPPPPAPPGFLMAGRPTSRAGNVPLARRPPPFCWSAASAGDLGGPGRRRRASPRGHGLRVTTGHGPPVRAAPTTCPGMPRSTVATWRWRPGGGGLAVAAWRWRPVGGGLAVVWLGAGAPPRLVLCMFWQRYRPALFVSCIAEGSVCSAVLCGAGRHGMFWPLPSAVFVTHSVPGARSFGALPSCLSALERAAVSSGWWRSRSPGAPPPCTVHRAPPRTVVRPARNDRLAGGPGRAAPPPPPPLLTGQSAAIVASQSHPSSGASPPQSIASLAAG